MFARSLSLSLLLGLSALVLVAAPAAALPTPAQDAAKPDAAKPDAPPAKPKGLSALAGNAQVSLDWTDSSAIHKADKSGKMSNTLAVEVGREKVRFLVNGTEVLSADNDKVDTAGIAGVRVNHNLNVNIEGFTVKPR